MAKNTQKNYHRLPVTFHQTFIPERAHISALLKFAAKGHKGTSTPLSVTDQEISAETGLDRLRTDGAAGRFHPDGRTVAMAGASDAL